MAREYGFASWARLKLEVERRMTEVIEVLVAAGAKIHSLEQAAATGDLTGWPLDRFMLESRIRALVFAADHQRLDAIDQLVAAGTPVNVGGQAPGT